MNSISLDSSALIEAERRSPEMLAALAQWRDSGVRLSISAVALAEWCVGWHAVKDPDRKARASRFFESFVDLLPVQHVVKRDALRTGEIVGKLKASGVTLEIADALIGCQALRRNRAVVTSNTRHFSQISGIEIVDPNEMAPDVEDVEGQKD
jgi:predicted nucleic acid-binding protein